MSFLDKRIARFLPRKGEKNIQYRDIETTMKTGFQARGTKLMLALLVLALPIITLFSTPMSRAEATPHKAGALMVKMRHSTPEQARALHVAAGSTNITSIPQLGIQIVQVAEGHLQHAHGVFANSPLVSEVAFDYVTESAGSPNDPYYVDGTQWGLQKINSEPAWGLATGSGATIAILDSGIDTAHPDLQAALLPGYNFYNSNSNTNDGCGHGTHVAGIAAASGNNGIGVAGVAFNAQILPVKVVGDTCAGNYSSMIKGLVYAADQGANVVNISSGASIFSQPLLDAVRYARNKGVVVVAAAGNRNSDAPFYPASFDEVISVSGTDNYDQRYTQSSYGTKVDVSAPATAIMSTYVNGTGSTYSYMTGTSMAASHVAGLAALLFSLSPTMDAITVETLIVGNTDDLGAAGWDQYFGHGRINAARATAAALMHVNDIDGIAVRSAKNKWLAQASVSVQDALGNPLPGVTVSGLWSDVRKGSVSCTTDMSGTCSVSSPSLRNKTASTSFAVTDLLSASRVYNPLSNYDLDGDSDGTTITIAMP